MPHRISARIGDALASLATDVEGADHPPTKRQEEVLVEYRTRLTRALDEWKASRDADVPVLKQSGQAAPSEEKTASDVEIIAI